MHTVRRALPWALLARHTRVQGSPRSRRLLSPATFWHALGPMTPTRALSLSSQEVSGAARLTSERESSLAYSRIPRTSQGHRPDGTSRRHRFGRRPHQHIRTPAPPSFSLPLSFYLSHVYACDIRILSLSSRHCWSRHFQRDYMCAILIKIATKSEIMV